MIEKLVIQKLTIAGKEYEYPDTTALVGKINELVDTVNKHEDIIKQIGEWGSSKGECLWCETQTEVNLNDRMIGCTTLDIPKSYKQDPYSEQRKWIGKVCKFWNWDTGLAHYSKLITIKDINDGEKSNCPFRADDGGWYMYCEPVKPDDDIIYKGDDNE